MDRGTDTDTDQHIEPNPPCNFCNLSACICQSFSPADLTIVVMITDRTLIDKIGDLIFQREPSDQRAAQNRKDQPNGDMGQSNRLIEDACEQDHRSQINQWRRNQE